MEHCTCACLIPSCTMPGIESKGAFLEVPFEEDAQQPLSALEDPREICSPGTSITALTAAGILNNMTFDEVHKYYSDCYDFFPHWRELIRSEFQTMCNIM